MAEQTLKDLVYDDNDTEAVIEKLLNDGNLLRRYVAPSGLSALMREFYFATNFLDEASAFCQGILDKVKDDANTSRGYK